jgi:3-isopropylmalate/(R)-2-methylmalate dehydratase small subunit
MTVTPAEAERLQALVKAKPSTKLTMDVEKKEIRVEGGETIRAQMPEPKRQALVSGTWDSTGLLLANASKTADTAKRLPYVSGFY